MGMLTQQLAGEKASSLQNWMAVRRSCFLSAAEASAQVEAAAASAGQIPHCCCRNERLPPGVPGMLLADARPELRAATYERSERLLPARAATRRSSGQAEACKRPQSRVPAA